MTASAWLIAGLFLGAAELLAPGVYLLWLGIAACGVGVALLAAPVPLAGQVGLFALLALASVMTGQRWQRQGREADPNAPGSDLVGQRCTALAFSGPEGRVRFRDGEWPAELAPESGEVLPGQALVIVGVSGTRLVVCNV